jgi:hypothetical protein
VTRAVATAAPASSRARTTPTIFFMRSSRRELPGWQVYGLAMPGVAPDSAGLSRSAGPGLLNWSRVA